MRLVARTSNLLRREPPRAALDRTDRAILAALLHDVRRSNKELAAAVGLAPSSCLARVKRLRDAGVLRGAHAEIDGRALGVELEALVAVQLRRHARAEVEAFRRHALALPEVVAIFHVAGAVDFLIHVAVQNAHHLRNLALDAFTSRPEVARIETSLIFEATRAWRLTDYTEEPVAEVARKRRR